MYHVIEKKEKKKKVKIFFIYKNIFLDVINLFVSNLIVFGFSSSPRCIPKQDREHWNIHSTGKFIFLLGSVNSEFLFMLYISDYTEIIS